MNIGLFSSYGMKCGIAQYNLSLCLALQTLGHSVTIFGNQIETVRPDRRWLIAMEGSGEHIDVVRCFNAGAWSETGDFDYQLIFQELEQREIKLIIMQYQNGIFHDQNLIRLFLYCKQKEIEVIVSFHDSCIGPQFPFGLVEHYVCTHSRLMPLINNCYYIPHGAPAPVRESKELLKQRYNYRGTIVSTFGLGRTDYKLISAIAAELGYQFLVIDSTNSCLIDGAHIIYRNEWMQLDQLLLNLASADAIVLWYPEIDAYVSSSAVCQALATLRPVIVNDVGWFRDIPDDVVVKVKHEEELSFKLSAVAGMPLNPKQLEYVEQHQWQRIARKYLQLIDKPIRF